MSILAWIEDQRRLKLLNAPKYSHPASDGSKGLWTRCDHCGVILYIKHLKENQRVCFGCGYHLQMDSQERIDHLIDENTWRPLDETLSPCDPLLFRDQKPYTERLREAQERTGLQDAVQTGTGLLDGIPIALGVMDFNFMGGSMGSAVGEKITRLIEYATQEGLTLVLVCASGGARMQEGIFSLMQMAKISSALQIYQSSANLLYISVLTSPTTGGVTASFAMLGDLIFAEPKALIGFAGRRVIEQTLQEELPDDFQTSEYLLHHGLLDLIVPRCFLKQALSETITLYRDAPFKPRGHIPYGVQEGLHFLTEERVRRRWQDWTSSLQDGPAKPSSAGHGVTAPKGESATRSGTRLAGDPVGSVPSERGSAIPELLEACLDTTAQVPPSVNVEATRPTLGASGKAPLPGKVGQQDRDWSRLGTSPDDDYRSVLLSFEAMFGLFMEEAAFGDEQTMAKASPLLGRGALMPSVADQRPVGGGNAPSGGDGECHHDLEALENSMAMPPYNELARAGTPSNLIDLAFTVSLEESIGWRAFYTTHKESPRAELLEGAHRWESKPHAEEGRSTTPQPVDPSGSSLGGAESIRLEISNPSYDQLDRAGNRFLYTMLLRPAKPGIAAWDEVS
jgi:acetyl-CoA carboxylase carboxyl transferase subunit beta|uniref:Acetyl-coenzyme A carboxylase carboxyl transferase subunit beta, chloroplastic n=1 Tax=Trebouxiophyceae sp. MX-AZ01 TaxID=1208065 RepID=J7KDS7_9CHLO|nr:acetyl-CoA carboxylase beta subunit [Trebouxiophyceae sp. MX-AZ01]AFQ93852.1 acetyl-CoA carboxylase beta subunit [Trebouxiophyceae sp. MX-AZ01]